MLSSGRFDFVPHPNQNARQNEVFAHSVFVRWENRNGIAVRVNGMLFVVVVFLPLKILQHTQLASKHSLHSLATLACFVLSRRGLVP